MAEHKPIKEMSIKELIQLLTFEGTIGGQWERQALLRLSKEIDNINQSIDRLYNDRL